jgi:hypothetical protein
MLDKDEADDKALPALLFKPSSPFGSFIFFFPREVPICLIADFTH